MVKDLKELTALLKLCRKQGVTEIEFDNIKLKLGELPQEVDTGTKSITDEVSEDKYANFPQGELTPEQLAFYSSGGSPENDPYRDDGSN